MSRADENRDTLLAALEPSMYGFVAVFTSDRAHMASVQEVFANGHRDTVALIGADDPDEANDRAAFIADALNRRAKAGAA